jgi:hypothetical protein
MKTPLLPSLIVLPILTVAAFAQDVQQAPAPQQGSPVLTTQNSLQTQIAAMNAFQQEQQAITQEQQALLTSGASAQDIMAWNQKNAALFQDLAAKAKNLSVPPSMRPWPLATGSQFPPDASPELKDFATTQADLSNKLAQFHNQRLQAGIVSTQPGDEWTLFSQQNATELQTLQQQGKILVQKTVPQVLPIPSPSNPPAYLSPEQRAFIIAHDQIIREQTVLMNQYVAADAQTRAAAMQQWQHANAARLQQLKELADKIPATSAPIPAPITTATPQSTP